MEYQGLSAGALDERAGYRTVRPNGRDDWLVIHTVAGRGRFGTHGGECFAEPGDTMLIRPHTLHDYGVEPALQHWRIEWAHFFPRPDWLVLLDWPEIAPGLCRVRSTGDIEQRIIGALRQTAQFCRSGMRRHGLFAMNSLEAALLWCGTQNPAASRVDDRVLRVIEHVDRHLAEPLDVAELAQVARLSVSRFTRLFAGNLGVSPQRYVERQRLDQARQLLDLTARPVNTIAKEVGYADPLYFSARFKRRTGLSPTAYRARH